MANVTPNLRLNLPTYDQPGWDTLMNANLQIIDSLVARVATLGGIYLGIYLGGASYGVNNVVTDQADSSLWQAQSSFTTGVGVTFAAERAANPSHWVNVTTATNNAAASAVQAAGSATTAQAAQVAASAAQTATATNATNAATSSAQAVTAAASITTLFRNKFINPLMTITQMNAVGSGVGALNTAPYINDGWQITCTGAPLITGNFAAAVDADRVAIGDEEVTNILTTNVTNAVVGSTDTAILVTKIPNLRTTSGKTVTISFWAKAASGTPKVALELAQNFGTGGSPTASVTNIGVQTFTLSTTWTRYVSTPIAIPSVAGATFGTTAGTNNLSVALWMSAGSSTSTRNNSIGSQTFQFLMWGAQFEFGSAVSPLEKRADTFESLMCQRYYETNTFVFGGYNSAGGGSTFDVRFKVNKNTVPTISIPSPTLTNCTISSAADVQHVNFSLLTTALGANLASGTWIADARL